jgi:hypothetical protein
MRNKMSFLPLVFSAAGFLLWIIDAGSDTSIMDAQFTKIAGYAMMLTVPVCIFIFSRRGLLSDQNIRILRAVALVVMIVQFAFLVFNLMGRLEDWNRWLPGATLVSDAYYNRSGPIVLSDIFIIISSILCYCLLREQFLQKRCDYEQFLSQIRQSFDIRLRIYKDRSSLSVVSDDVEAVLFAQAVKRSVLNAPSTAVFSPVEETNVRRERNRYIVSGWVRAQSDYGAMVRSPFTLQVAKKDGVWNTMDAFGYKEIVRKQNAQAIFRFVIFTAIVTMLTILFIFTWVLR